MAGSFEAVIHMQESTRNVPKTVGQMVLSRMQLTLHAIRRIPHGASRAWCTRCLLGRTRATIEVLVYIKPFFGFFSFL